MFTSDNFNKYEEATELLEAMISEDLRIPFFVQCDTQVAKQEELVDLMGRAGCFQMFVGAESFSRKILLAAHKSQNHPQTYGEIVRLCRSRGIITHFSNIIGFPEDTVQGIREHLDELIRLGPDAASFYILTPLPGTQQYDEFLAAKKIFERNLDRFDGTHPVWHHESLDWRLLPDLLFECYRKFYSASRLTKYLDRRPVKLAHSLGLHLFCRFAAFRRMHPMSGGIGRVYRDQASHYRHLRRKLFDIDLAPLPESLQLSEEDRMLNSRAASVS
jgi:radical SAM superfamily enzyme YgiQ (UPF0313 family)